MDLQLARKQLEDELKSLPENDKSAYFEGMLVAPDVVEEDSFYLCFLRFEKYQVKEAAKRLALYWTYRKDLFGDRSFRRLLDLSGDGALDAQDIEVLKLGLTVQVANDSEGCSVLVNDPSRLTVAPAAVQNQRARCTFYVHAKACFLNPLSQTKGIRLLRPVTGGVSKHLDHTLNRKHIKRVLCEVLPQVVKQFLLCCIPKEGSRKHLFTTVIPSLLDGLGPKVAKAAQIHVADNSTAMLHDLEKLGLKAEGLVPALGGTWSYEQYCKSIDSYAKVHRHTETSTATQKPQASTDHSTQRDHAKMPFKKRGVSVEHPRFPESPSASDIKGSQECDEAEARRLIEEAICELPAMDKAAFEEAVRTAPKVVADDTFFLSFLRFHEFKAKSAASHVLRYWTYRKNTFEDRAFRNLFDLSGNGVLTSENVESLKSGFLVPLPRDSEGCSVVVNNVSRKTTDFAASFDVELRCKLYVWATEAFKNPVSQAKGLVSIQVMTQSNLSVKTQTGPKKCLLHFVQDMLPFRMKKLHVCCVTTKESLPYFLKTVIPAQIIRCGEEIAKITKVHIATQGKSIVPQLQEYGLKAEGLVIALGGSWSYDEFAKSIDEERNRQLQELKIERKSPPPASEDYPSKRQAVKRTPKKSILESKAPAPMKAKVQKRAPNSIGGSKDAEVGAEAELPRKEDKQLHSEKLETQEDSKAQGKGKKRMRFFTEEARKNRKRELDAMYARKRRKREKVDEESMHMEYSDLKQANMRLKDENARLEKLMRDAQAKIAEIEGIESPHDTDELDNVSAAPVSAHDSTEFIGDASSNKKETLPEVPQFQAEAATVMPGMEVSQGIAPANEILAPERDLFSAQLQSSLEPQIAPPRSFAPQGSFVSAANGGIYDHARLSSLLANQLATPSNEQMITQSLLSARLQNSAQTERLPQMQLSAHGSLGFSGISDRERISRLLALQGESLPPFTGRDGAQLDASSIARVLAERQQLFSEQLQFSPQRGISQRSFGLNPSPRLESVFDNPSSSLLGSHNALNPSGLVLQNNPLIPQSSFPLNIGDSMTGTPASHHNNFQLDQRFLFQRADQSQSQADPRPTEGNDFLRAWMNRR